MLYFVYHAFSMKKFVFFLTFLSIAVSSGAQVYQLLWNKGQILYAIPTSDFDSVSYEFSDDIDMSQVKVLDKMLVGRVIHDTIYTVKYVYDTVYLAPPVKGIGTFSVSSYRKVTFSPGNLQYQASTNSWRFAPKQTDYIGDNNQYISSYYSGWIDLFGWGTGSAPTKTSTSYSSYSSYTEWGSNPIGNDAANTWRMLTKDEWYYLRYTRANASKLCGIAQVNGVNGLILLPDDWVCPSGVYFKSGFSSYEGKEYFASYQSFSADQGSKMEKAGAVFLPAAGYRNGTSLTVSNAVGWYWTSTPSGSSEAYYFNFDSDSSGHSDYERDDGHAVRLVKDL